MLTVPKAACNPATESPRLIFGLTGGPDNEPVSGSTKPLMYRNPDSASQTDAYPGLDDQGPVCPYPLARVNASEGLSGCNADGPSPHFSSAEKKKRQRRLHVKGTIDGIKEEFVITF